MSRSRVVAGLALGAVICFALATFGVGLSQNLRLGCAGLALVVGITHSDQGGWQTRQMVSRELVAMGLPPTAMDTDARSRAHMATLVKALIYGIDPFNNAEE